MLLPLHRRHIPCRRCWWGRRGRRSLPSPCGWHPQLVAFAASCGSVASTVTRPCLATPTASAAGIAQPGRITTVAGGFTTAGYACYLPAALPHLTELLTPTLRGRSRQTRCCYYCRTDRCKAYPPCLCDGIRTPRCTPRRRLCRAQYEALVLCGSVGLAALPHHMHRPTHCCRRYRTSSAVESLHCRCRCQLWHPNPAGAGAPGCCGCCCRVPFAVFRVLAHDSYANEG